MKLQHRMTYSLLALAARWLKRLSWQKRQRLSRSTAGFIYHWIPLRREMAFQNLRLAFPHWTQRKQTLILRRTYTFFTESIIHSLAFPQTLESMTIQVRGQAYLDRALRQGKGVILISGHFGAWEVLSAWLGTNGYPLVPVAYRQRNRGADKFFRELRGSTGVFSIYRKESLEKMYAVLEARKILGLVSDQDARKRGVFVSFFNRPTSTPKGVALFHLKTKAPMIFATCRKTGDASYILDIAPVPVKTDQELVSITQTYTDLLEEKIRQSPEQYFWFHHRWKTRPTDPSQEDSAG